MKFTRKILMAGSGVALMAGSVALIGPGIASAKGAVAATGSITCTSISGTLKFSPPLSTSGGTTGSETTTFKGKVGGCSGGSPTASGGTVSLKNVSNNGNSCSGFATSTGNSAQTFTIKWKSSPKISPTTTTFPAGDITVSPNGQGFTLQSGPGGPVTGSGSYPGSDNFAGSKATANSNTNLETGLCKNKAGNQKTIKITSGSDTVG